LAHSILQHLEMLNKEDGLTIMCSLHYLDLVQRYSTQVIGLREGKLVYQGTKKDIINMTNDEFKQIYGEEAVRIGGGLEGNLEMAGGVQ
jgi:phosphonate transport system ATP-binding protein